MLKTHLEQKECKEVREILSESGIAKCKDRFEYVKIAIKGEKDLVTGCLTTTVLVEHHDPRM